MDFLAVSVYVPDALDGRGEWGEAGFGDGYLGVGEGGEGEGGEGVFDVVCSGGGLWWGWLIIRIGGDSGRG